MSLKSMAFHNTNSFSKYFDLIIVLKQFRYKLNERMHHCKIVKSN